MALEDAACLGQAVEAHGHDLQQALRMYNCLRAPRTGRVQISSRLIGELIYHASDAKAEVRNAALRANSAVDFYDGLEWLYGRASQQATVSRQLPPPVA